jgi:predicted dehydrogenase
MSLIQDPEVELVDICLPTFLHKQFIEAGLAAGKHVFCEKPISLTTTEAREILSIVKSSDKHFMVGMCIRFWPEYRHAYEVVKSGKIGKIKSATFRRISPNISGISWENWFMKEKMSGGGILDLHLHDTDAIRYFFGKPERVTSFGMKGFRSDSGIDHVVTCYDFGNDLLVYSEGSWAPAAATPFEMSFLIVGEQGTIRLSETGYKIIYEDGKVESPVTAREGLPTGWHVEIDYLLDCIQKNVPPVDYLALEETVESLSIIEAESRSIREKSTIEVKY